MFCSVLSFAQFFADTMLIVEEIDSAVQNESIVKRVSGEKAKSQGVLKTIAFESGVQKDRGGAVGNFENFSIRGISGGRLGVFLNGNSVASAAGATVDMSRFNGLNISNIKIYKGFVPAQLGGNTLGGAVDIITENYNDENIFDFNSQFFLLLGSFGETHSFVNINFIPVSPKTKLSLSGNWHSAENNYKYMDYNGTFYGKGHEKDDTIRTMDNNKYRSFSLSGNIKNSQKNFDINGDFSVFRSIYEIPSPAGVLYKFRNQSAYDENGDYAFSLTQKFHGGFENKINIFAIFSNDKFCWTSKDNIAFPYSLLPKNGKGEIATKNSVFDFGYFHKFEAGRNFAVSLYASTRFEKINYQNEITGFDISDREVNRLNGAVSADLSFFTPYPEIILGGTIRGYADKTNNWKEGFVYKNIPDATNCDSDKSLRFNINNYFLIKPIQIFADAVFAERIPNLRQRYGYYGIIPSTNLLPEKIFSSQVGINSGSYDKIKVSTASFVNYSHDLIRIVYFGNVGKAQNIAKSITYGIENDIFYKISPKVELKNNLTYQEPRNLSEKSNKKLYLPNESRLKINTEIKIGDFAGFCFIPSFSYKSAYYHDLYNIHRVPFDEKRKGLSFFHFVLEQKIDKIMLQIGVYDICTAGNSPEKITALENQYFVLRYPGISMKSSVLWEI
jgi:hypothetical protein